MDATQSLPLHPSTAAASTHPLILATAASVTALCLAGIAYLAGWLPGPGKTLPDASRQTTASSQPATAPISVQQTVTVPQDQHPPKTSARQAESPTSASRRTQPGFVARSTDLPRVQSPVAVPVTTTAPAPVICRECGTVESVRNVVVEPKASGGGAVAGGIVGGIIGNQWGRGATRDIATVLGAVGGAYAGNHIEKSIKGTKRYDMAVRFEDGSTRTFSSETLPAWHVGDRVRLQNGLLTSGGGRSSMDIGAI